MKKFLTIVASATMLAGVLLAAPSTASAGTTKYDYFVAHNASSYHAGLGISCKAADYDNLQDALDAAGDSDKIYVCAGNWKPSDDGQDSYYVDTDVEIIGAGATRTYIDGGCSGFSTMYVYESYVTVRNITFRNGCSTGDSYSDGGAIYADNSAINCYASVFANNTASDIGGAISAVSVYSDGCTFTGNSAFSEESPWGGGAIAAMGIYAGKSTFTNNHGAGAGGAVATVCGFMIWNSKFSQNSSDSDGGALYSEYASGAPCVNVDVRNSTFTGNVAGADGNSYAVGGAIAFEWGTALVSGGAFKNNLAMCAGGAIAGVKDTAVNASRTIFSGNSTRGDCDSPSSWGWPTSVPVGGDAILAGAVHLDRANFQGNYGSGTAVWAWCNLDEVKVRYGAGQESYSWDC